jgi:dTDP-4-dehydrorhamnose reductase
MIIGNLTNCIEVTLFNDVFFTPILAETLISTVHELLNKKAKGIFHVSSDDRISKYEFGLMIADIFNLDHRLIKQGSISDQKGLVQRPFDMSLSNEKAALLLGRSIGKVANDILRLRRQQESGLNKEIIQI